MTIGKALTVAVAEDEPLARERIVRLLQEAGCEVLAELVDGPSLLAWLREAPTVDALFLDILMPGATSFEVIGELEGQVNLPPLVFVTAHPQHSLRAFDVAAIDYLMKPVSADRLEKTLLRLLQGSAAPKPAKESKSPKGTALRFPAKAGEGLVMLDLRKTTHFEVSQEVVWAWAQGKRFRTSWRSLAEVEQAFPQASLLRIQRQILLMTEAVLALKPIFGGRARIRIGEGQELEVSRTATPKLKEILGM